MTTLNNLTNEQKQILLHCKKRYEEVIEQINLFGQVFASHLKSKHDSELDILYFDIISRIANNLFCLTLVPPQNATVVATRLILRSIFSDLILAFALLCSEQEEAERICTALSLDSYRSQKNALLLERTIAERMPTFALDTNSITKRIEYIESKITQKVADLKKHNSKIPDTKISTFADILGKSAKSYIPTDLKELLYSTFRRLSQSEHYSTIGRGMSKFDKDKIFSFSLYSDWIAIAIYYLLNALSIEYNISEFKAKLPNNLD